MRSAVLAAALGGAMELLCGAARGTWHVAREQGRGRAARGAAAGEVG